MMYMAMNCMEYNRDMFLYLQQLIDAVARQLIERTILVLAYCNSEHINAPYSKTDTRTALHIASALGNSVLIQLLIWVSISVAIGFVKRIRHWKVLVSV